MKEPSKTIKKQDLGANFMPMVIFISENILKIKNMEKALFIGSVCTQISPNNPHSSNIMAHGGEVYPMEKGNISNLMVFYQHNLGDNYIGGFKNGLKHGKGV